MSFRRAKWKFKGAAKLSKARPMATLTQVLIEAGPFEGFLAHGVVIARVTDEQEHALSCMGLGRCLDPIMMMTMPLEAGEAFPPCSAQRMRVSPDTSTADASTTDAYTILASTCSPSDSPLSQPSPSPKVAKEGSVHDSLKSGSCLEIRAPPQDLCVDGDGAQRHRPMLRECPANGHTTMAVALANPFRLIQGGAPCHRPDPSRSDGSMNGRRSAEAERVDSCSSGNEPMGLAVGGRRETAVTGEEIRAVVGACLQVEPREQDWLEAPKNREQADERVAREQACLDAPKNMEQADKRVAIASESSHVLPREQVGESVEMDNDHSHVLLSLQEALYLSTRLGCLRLTTHAECARCAVQQAVLQPSDPSSEGNHQQYDHARGNGVMDDPQVQCQPCDAAAKGEWGQQEACGPSAPPGQSCSGVEGEQIAEQRTSVEDSGGGEQRGQCESSVESAAAKEDTVSICCGTMRDGTTGDGTMGDDTTGVERGQFEHGGTAVGSEHSMRDAAGKESTQHDSKLVGHAQLQEVTHHIQSAPSPSKPSIQPEECLQACTPHLSSGHLAMSPDELWAYGLEQQQQQQHGVQQESVGFAELSAVYCHLRDRGWVVRPGLQYGAHYSAYRHHPELVHSSFLALVQGGDSVPSSHRHRWTDLLSCLRLSSNVCKDVLLFQAHVESGYNLVKGTPTAVYPTKKASITAVRVSRWNPERHREDGPS